MDNAREVTPSSVDRMLHILRIEGKELARFLVDEEEITPPDLIHPLLTTKVITQSHVQAILRLDHTSEDKYYCLLMHMVEILAASISSGFSNDTVALVKNFISILQDCNLHRIAYRLHPQLAASYSNSDTENSSLGTPGEVPNFNTYRELPNKKLGPSSNPPYSSRRNENGGALSLSPTPPSSSIASAAAQSSDGNTSYYTASSGDSVSPHMRPSESYPSFGTAQGGDPSFLPAAAPFHGVRESASDGNIPNIQAEAEMEIVVEYNRKVFGPMDNEPSDDDKYRNSSHPRGLVFLANYSFEKNTDHKHREGSDVDVKNLHSLFEQMGYIFPTIHQNLNKADTLLALKEFRDDERHKRAHSCVVIIMSHGKDDSSFYTNDGRSLSTTDVLELFSNRECTALIDKPKIFILQYCRGDRKDMGVPPLAYVSRAFRHIVQTDSANMGHTSATSNKPTFSDMLLVYATVEGYVSFRDPKYGTWLIEALCQVFMKQACNYNIDQLLKKVSKLVSERESEDGKKQSCEIRLISFNKDFYFNPTKTFDETRLPCVGSNDSGSCGGSSMVVPEANGLSEAVPANGHGNGSSGETNSPGDSKVGSSGTSNRSDVSANQPAGDPSNGPHQPLNSNHVGELQSGSANRSPHCHPAPLPGNVFTFKHIGCLPPLPNNYDTILKACPSPRALDSSSRLSGADGELDDSGINMYSSGSLSCGGGRGALDSTSSSNSLQRKSSSVTTTGPNGDASNGRQGERLLSSGGGSSDNVFYLPPEHFIRRDSDVSVSFDMGGGDGDGDTDSLLLRSLEESLLDA